MKQIIFLALILAFTACKQTRQAGNNPPEEKSDYIYQYSVFTALANKIYDGAKTVSDVKEKGDLGLGTFNGLNGEMIVSDGHVFQLLSNGTVREPGNDEWVPFTVVTFFESDFSFTTEKTINYEELKKQIVDNLPSENFGYAFKIQGNFRWIKCGGAEKKQKPYSKTLSDALVNRPVFETENINGTLVGFWFPEYTGKTNVVGFHLHFISDDKKFAGHVIDFETSDLSIMIDKCNGFEIELPDTKEFIDANFDLNQEYNNSSNK